MKKRFAVLLALSLTLGVLAGCGDKTNTDGGNTTESQNESAIAGATTAAEYESEIPVVDGDVDALTLLPLGDMRTESELASLGEDFADFGLAGTVRASVKLIAKDGESQVFFGALSASGKDVYARADGLLHNEIGRAHV